MKIPIPYRKWPIGYAFAAAVFLSTLGAIALQRALPAQGPSGEPLSLGEQLSRHIKEGRIQRRPVPSRDRSWRLVASRATSNAWLYSARTGRVYRVLEKCPQGYPDGCLIPLPVVYGPHLSDALPSHGDDH